MESVTVKFNEDLLKAMDTRIAKHRYASRTEFIRAAVREKLENFSREEAFTEFMALRGKLKPKTSKTDEEIREEVGREMLQELHDLRRSRQGAKPGQHLEAD